MPFGAWIGITFLTNSPHVVSIGLIFAAATMIWIVVCEITPRAFSLHRFGALLGLCFGGLFMYIIHLFHG